MHALDRDRILRHPAVFRGKTTCSSDRVVRMSQGAVAGGRCSRKNPHSHADTRLVLCIHDVRYMLPKFPELRLGSVRSDKICVEQPVRERVCESNNLMSVNTHDGHRTSL